MTNYECSLQRLVSGQEQKDYLIERLIDICGNDFIADLYEHEIVFTPSGPTRNDDVVLRVQSVISNEQERSFKFRLWYLYVQGNPEPQHARTVTVRPNTRVQISGDVFRFMKSLVYIYSFEVVREGKSLAHFDNCTP